MSWTFSDPDVTFESQLFTMDGASIASNLWAFDSAQMTFGDPRYTFDGLFALTPIPTLRVCAVTAGTYNGEYYEPGDVFDLLQSVDYSDSTKNIQPAGNEYAPGWMLSVDQSTPLYQASAVQGYPTFPAVDPARRFVM